MTRKIKLVGQELDVLQEDSPHGARAELVSLRLARPVSNLPAIDDLLQPQLQGDASVVQARHVLQPDGDVWC